MGYEFSIAECDVPQERRPALESYRAKRGQWLAWLDTDEHHAIWSAISAMVWTDVSFRTLVQIATDNEKSSLSNTLIAEQIIYGHVARQVLAIRRLVDKTRGIMSLRRLISELRSNFGLFTRENSLTQQLLTLVVRGAKIGHEHGGHDDLANAVCGAINLAAGKGYGVRWAAVSGDGKIYDGDNPHPIPSPLRNRIENNNSSLM
jgi:hypothetical protein